MGITYVATDCVCEMTETPSVMFFFFMKAHYTLTRNVVSVSLDGKNLSCVKNSQ